MFVLQNKPELLCDNKEYIWCLLIYSCTLVVCVIWQYIFTMNTSNILTLEKRKNDKEMNSILCIEWIVQTESYNKAVQRYEAVMKWKDKFENVYSLHNIMPAKSISKEICLSNHHQSELNDNCQSIEFLSEISEFHL